MPREVCQVNYRLNGQDFINIKFIKISAPSIFEENRYKGQVSFLSQFFQW